MTKRLVDIDDDLLERARLHLGTTALKDTVNTALLEILKDARRRTITSTIFGSLRTRREI